MPRKKQTGFFYTEKIGPVEKCEDGWYRRKNGNHELVIGKGWEESWYRPDEPGTKEEQWAAIEAALKEKGEKALFILGIYAVIGVCWFAWLLHLIFGG